MKVRDLVHASARVIGIVASGKNMTDAELSDAVSSLNMLLGQWSTSRDYVFSTQDIEINLNGNSLHQVEAKLISDDAKLNGEEIKIYRDIALNKPKNCIEYFKMPNGYALRIPAKITGILIIQSLISPPFPLKATDDVMIPNEYFRAIKYALAIELAPEYQLPITQDVQQQYQQAMRIMHRAQSTPTPVKPDPVLMGISRGRHWDYHD
ncbi:hypothetical protein I9189_015810 [Acinetobacter bereziniae]|uniref:hypothetical protein n=1 Tax=Acinetobacter bereziniae TaxID=106648 RepID=UPI0021B2C751|nr:hypothetical protein [Acinetobacter bereziniae]UUN92528.1 hypothetical protein I9189_015810 [Acinetobacter bereziniae]